jgi:hypothetical protein
MNAELFSEQIDRQKFLATGGNFSSPKTKLAISIASSFANAVGSSAGNSAKSCGANSCGTTQHEDKLEPGEMRELLGTR